MAEGPERVWIRLNGAEQQVETGCSVAELVEALGLPAGAVAVEIDRRLVPRRTWGERRIEPGQSVELVTLVGGG
jgi:thiamine biosynthesis protein ThiS